MKAKDTLRRAIASGDKQRLSGNPERIHTLTSTVRSFSVWGTLATSARNAGGHLFTPGMAIMLNEVDSDDQVLIAALEPKIVAAILDATELKLPATTWLKWVKAELMQDLNSKYVIACIHNYFEKYKQIPTRDVLWNHVAKTLTTDCGDGYKIKDLIETKSDPREFTYIKEELNKWCEHRIRGLAFSNEALIAYKNHDYSVNTNIEQMLADLKSDMEGRPFGFMKLADLLAKEDSSEWLIDGLIEKNAVFFVGGKKKCLKTAIICDLIVSIATGTKMLNHFQVSSPRRVGFFSVETGPDHIKCRINSLLHARGISKTDQLIRNMDISFQAPKLSDDDDLLRIRKFCEDECLEALVIDPLYLTLLTGNAQASASSLFDMGGVLIRVAETCLSVGTTPILVHHFKKSAGDDLDLDDFSFTGAAEFARQSLLIGRASPYTGPTTHHMRIRTHGYGRGDLYDAFINEGTLDAPKWSVRMVKSSEITANERKQKFNDNIEELVKYLADQEGKLTSKNAITKDLGWNHSKVTEAISAALEAELIVEVQDGRFPSYRIN